jgi:serine/threonine protein kinase
MFNVYDKSQASQLFKEISMLASVDCDALITLKGAFHHEGNIGVILEHMDHGSLDFLLGSSVSIDEETFAGIAYQVIWGLGYLHFDNRLVRNIIINSDYYILNSKYNLAS